MIERERERKRRREKSCRECILEVTGCFFDRDDILLLRRKLHPRLVREKKNEIRGHSNKTLNSREGGGKQSFNPILNSDFNAFGRK